MDSNRLIINNIDQSTVAVSTTTSVVGFTVVKAPKGPITPVRVPAGKTSIFQDVFGLPSKKYSELFEASTFNREYDTIISAPYVKAEVPVAYVTKDGIFPSAKLVPYTKELENLTLGKDDFAKVPGVTEDPSDGTTVTILKNVKYPSSTNFVKGSKLDLSSDTIPEYKSNSLIIKTNLTFEQKNFSDQKFRISNLPFAVGKEKAHHLDFTISGKNIMIGLNEVGSIVTEAELDSENLMGREQQVFKLEGNDSETTFTKAMVSNFDSNAARENLRVDYLIDIDMSTDVYATLYPKYPSERALHISFDAFSKNTGYIPSTAYGKNLLNMHVYEDEAFHDKNKPLAINGSLDSNAKNGFGSFLGFTNANTSYSAGQNLLAIHVIKEFTSSDIDAAAASQIKFYPSITLDEGTRDLGGNPSFEESETITINKSDYTDVHSLGWFEAESEEFSNVDLFFDSCVHDLDPLKDEATVGAANGPDKIFLNLANPSSKMQGKKPLAGFIFNLTASEANINNKLSTGATALYYGANYWNVCNEGIIEINKTGERFKSPLTGARALMQARIISSRWGGVAPMYLNSGSPAVGGVLNSVIDYGTSIVGLTHKYNKEQQMFLDSVNMNPIIKDNTYGVMVVGQKTCKEGPITDWSYIGHVSAFLNFQKEVRENVMIPQLGKANNDYYRTLRKQQVDQILAKRINGNNRIWAAAVVDTSTADGVNDIANRKARKFVIDVKVKVDVFSEYVVLNFTNVDQETNL